MQAVALLRSGPADFGVVGLEQRSSDGDEIAGGRLVVAVMIVDSRLTEMTCWSTRRRLRRVRV
jgi:hypothetical protein